MSDLRKAQVLLNAMAAQRREERDADRQTTCVRCGTPILQPSDTHGHVLGEGAVHAGRGCPVVIEA